MEPKWRSWLYWFFGGRIDNSPVKAIQEMWTSCKKELNTGLAAVENFFAFSRKVSNGGSSHSWDIELPQEPTHQG